MTPSGSARWDYDVPSGFLAAKYDAANLDASGQPKTGAKKLSYSYNVRGQTYQRTSARNVLATYRYADKTGELTSIEYSGVTPSVGYTYNRAGEILTATDSTGQRTFNYGTATGGNALELDSINLPAFFNNRRLTRQYDSIRRPAGFQIGSSSAPSEDLTQTYGYNAVGRFDHVETAIGAQAARTFTYCYYAFDPQKPTAPLVGGYASGSFSVSRGYEPYRNVLTSIDSKWGTTSRTRYDYVYDVLGQRYTAKQSGDAFANDFGGSIYRRYVYNSRGELTSAADYSGETPVALDADPNTYSSAQLPSRNFAYGFDNMGNRQTSSRNGTSGLDSYAMDGAFGPLNQYSSRTNNYVRAAGTVSASTTSVTVNGAGVGWVTGKNGRFWAADAQVQADSPPAYGTVSVTATWANGGGAGIDLVRTDSGRTLFLFPQRQSFVYDDDGNLTSDGVWSYTYDAENRLTSMETDPTIINFISAAKAKRLEFQYDYLGRRVQKLVRTGWNGSSYATVSFQRRYLYDGDNLVAELSGDGTNVVRSYTWGLDLTGSLTASGGVGALLQIVDHASGKSYFPTYDGNGNVTALLNASTGVAAVTYEYSPFGELLRAGAANASTAADTVIKDNPMRFSTKYTDDESGLVYYGARYYSPTLGRFINRDPIEESGGLNLYGFCGNDGVNRWDYLGNSPVYYADAGSKPVHDAGTAWNEFIQMTQAATAISKATAFRLRIDWSWQAQNAAKYAAAGIAMAYGKIGDSVAISYQDPESGEWVPWAQPLGPKSNVPYYLRPNAPNNDTSNPLKTYPGKTSPSVSNPAQGSTLDVDGAGRIKIVTNSQRFISPRRDDAPKGEVEAKMRMSFTPHEGRAATEFAWINWVISDPRLTNKSVPYQDRDGKAFNDLIFNPKDPNVYNDGVPKFSDGAINFYDRPGNPAGYGVDFSTYLYDRTNKSIIYRVDWRLSPDGKP